MEPLDDTTILLRLEHIFEKNEHSELSQPATVPLKVNNHTKNSAIYCWFSFVNNRWLYLFVIIFQNLFNGFEITTLRETALAADRWLEEAIRLEWKINTKEGEVVDIYLDDVDDLTITLKPMEIRTFIATITRK